MQTRGKIIPPSKRSALPVKRAGDWDSARSYEEAQEMLPAWLNVSQGELAKTYEGRQGEMVKAFDKLKGHKVSSSFCGILGALPFLVTLLIASEAAFGDGTTNVSAHPELAAVGIGIFGTAWLALWGGAWRSHRLSRKTENTIRQHMTDYNKRLPAPAAR